VVAEFGLVGVFCGVEDSGIKVDMVGDIIREEWEAYRQNR
jgi:hypothetical protein